VRIEKSEKEREQPLLRVRANLFI